MCIRDGASSLRAAFASKQVLELSCEPLAQLRHDAAPRPSFRRDLGRERNVALEQSLEFKGEGGVEDEHVSPPVGDEAAEVEVGGTDGAPYTCLL